jgi:putative tryptophan/tyrosine transport system substrate-binding protein
MNRRSFIALAGGTAAAWPLVARAQQALKTRRIAFVHTGIPADKLTEGGGTFWIRRFYEELRTLGYNEGANLVIDRASAEGSFNRFAAIAADVVARKPDLIVTNHATLIKALMAATTTIPLVAIMGDPVADGLATNLARPGGSLTGVSIVAGVGIAAKRRQVLREAVPTAAKIAYLLGAAVEELRSGGGIVPKILSEVNEAQLRAAFAEFEAQKIDAALMSDSGSFLARRALIVELAAQHRIPVIYPYRDYTEAGGLMSYGPELGELAKRMAINVHEIFNGAKAGDIPIFQPTKFQLVLNMKTAKALGLTIPPLLLAQADEVIE